MSDTTLELELPRHLWDYTFPPPTKTGVPIIPDGYAIANEVQDWCAANGVTGEARFQPGPYYSGINGASVHLTIPDEDAAFLFRLRWL